MHCKLLLFFTVALISAALAYPKTECGSGKTHDLFQGKREYGDRLLYTTHETISSKVLRKQTRDIVWPPGHPSLYTKITYIEVFDQIPDGKGGCAFLMDGGIGNNHVKLHLKTQRGGKFDFLIRIYGR
uniref:Heteropteran venom family 3 protein 2 n=1 Tax=Oncocephalus sp. TaxID=2944721 RepID=A0AB38ZET3_9HEMI